MNFRVGHGYDVHALGDGLRLVLGGVEIPHTKGCIAHSDGDVLVHAICDALLGAAALGDIGKHFPDTSAEFKGIDSLVLLRRVVELLDAEGYEIGNIDSTIAMQRPKLRPYIELMRERIAEAVGLKVEQISVKATTTEHLGFEGEEKGVSATAICLLIKNDIDMTIRNLEPKLVWEIFDDITRVPRPSKREEKIGAFLVEFAKSHNLEYQCDAIGNIVIRKAATAGYEGRPTVVLQAHTDMVCEKNSDKVFDFDNDAIQTFIDGDWVKADGTTLGADDGIGIAAALALLIDKSVEHPAIEALFTVDEETGLTGAFNLGEGMLTGKYLINLDSEDEGEVFIGCAGGIDTLAYLTLVTDPAPKDYAYYKVVVSGLLGGHSGDDIDKGHANSNKWAARIAERAVRLFGARLSNFDGGNLRNAIPREAYVVLGVPSDKAAEFESDVKAFGEVLCAEFAIVEKNAKVEVAKVEAPETVLSILTQPNLISALIGVPSGVLAMSAAMPGLVETSTNLASVKFTEDNVVVTTSQRSSSESAKEYAKMQVESVFASAGFEVTHSDGYPGWAPNPNSALLECTKGAYKRLFGTEPKVRAIHAGLECGLFLEKYSQLEMVSFGPTLRGVHSPDERLEIATVDKFWKLLVEVVKTIQ